jgi:hypothetical protein
MVMDNSNKIILDLCGGTGSWSEPYKQAGYDVRLITLPEHDVLTYKPPENVHGVLAAPPCTHFSIACAYLWKQKDEAGLTEQSLEIVRACFKIIEQCKPEFWALENPRGRLHKFIGNPSYKFHAYEFGAPYYKPTWIWGEFNMWFPRGPYNPNPVKLDRTSAKLLYELPQGYSAEQTDHKTRAARRSILPPAFCEAFFEANQ